MSLLLSPELGSGGHGGGTGLGMDGALGLVHLESGSWVSAREGTAPAIKTLTAF